MGSGAQGDALEMLKWGISGDVPKKHPDPKIYSFSSKELLDKVPDCSPLSIVVQHECHRLDSGLLLLE